MSYGPLSLALAILTRLARTKTLISGLGNGKSTALVHTSFRIESCRASCTSSVNFSKHFGNFHFLICGLSELPPKQICECVMGFDRLLGQETRGEPDLCQAGSHVWNVLL